MRSDSDRARKHALLEYARQVPHPRNHEDRIDLHIKARELQLQVTDILALDREYPELKLLEKARPKDKDLAAAKGKGNRKSKRKSKSKNPEQSKLPPRRQRLLAPSLLLVFLGLVLLLSAARREKSSVETHHRQRVLLCTGSPGSPKADGPMALNKLGPVSMKKGKDYILRLKARGKRDEKSLWRLDSKVAVVERGKSKALPLETLNRRRS